MEINVFNEYHAVGNIKTYCSVRVKCQAGECFPSLSVLQSYPYCKVTSNSIPLERSSGAQSGRIAAGISGAVFVTTTSSIHMLIGLLHDLVVGLNVHHSGRHVIAVWLT